MITAVLDANALASGFVGRNPQSAVVQALDAWRLGRYGLIISEHLLDELVHTFEDRYFQRRLTPSQMIRAQSLLRRRATLTPITVEVHGVATHPEDDLVLAAAVSAKADYLVTGDGKLQEIGSYEGVTIVSPRKFVENLAERQSGG